PNPGPSGPDKPQRHPVAFADRPVPGVVRVVVVVGRWQGPYAVGVVLGVLRVGVDPAPRVEPEAGRLGHRDHLLLADIAGLVVVGDVDAGAVFDHAQHAARLEYLEEAAEHALRLPGAAPVVHVAE